MTKTDNARESVTYGKDQTGGDIEQSEILLRLEDGDDRRDPRRKEHRRDEEREDEPQAWHPQEDDRVARQDRADGRDNHGAQRDDDAIRVVLGQRRNFAAANSHSD